MRTMDMDHTVFVASMDVDDGNLTASAARPPSWTPTTAAEPAPSAMFAKSVCSGPCVQRLHRARWSERLRSFAGDYMSKPRPGLERLWILGSTLVAAVSK